MPTPGRGGTEEFTCLGRGGGYLIALGPSDVNPVVNQYLSHPDYDEFASTFISRPLSNVVVFAPSDFEFWDGYNFESATFYDTFDAVDTDCLDPTTNDPALCG